MIGPSSRERRRRDHSRGIAGQVCIEAFSAAFRMGDTSLSDKRAWVLKSSFLRANPPFLTSAVREQPSDTRLTPRLPKSSRLRKSRREQALGGRARASGIRRSGPVIRRAGPELLLLGSQAAASIEGAQLPAERPQAGPGPRPTHGRRERPSPSIPQVRINHGGDSAVMCGRLGFPPLVRRSSLASIVRQGDIPDGRAKSTKQLKKIPAAADKTPLAPGRAGRSCPTRASARSARRNARRKVCLRRKGTGSAKSAGAALDNCPAIRRWVERRERPAVSRRDTRTTRRLFQSSLREERHSFGDVDYGARNRLTKIIEPHLNVYPSYPGNRCKLVVESPTLGGRGECPVIPSFVF